MRILNSLKMYTIGSFIFGWDPKDRAKVFYYQSKSYLNRFLLKAKPTNKQVSVNIANKPLYFRDNWFDPRSIPFVFENDYTELDSHIFDDCKTFIDVGANMGLISRSVRLHSPDCKIFCFEPLEENAALCRLNNPDVVVETCAVGDKDGSTELLVDSCGFMASSIKFGYAQQPRKVPLITLDGYFKSMPDLKIDLIKIDVEGMELNVLEGAKETIKRSKRVIAELHSDELLVAFGEKMEALGFKRMKVIAVERGIHIADWQKSSKV